jgi:hypothetical protein
MTAPRPSAAAAYGLAAPTEADLVALLSKTAGADAAGVVRQARSAAGVPPAGPLSLDALEKVTRAVVAAGAFPTTVSARSFLVRLGSFRALAHKGAPPSTYLSPAAV